jgi:hypothetical protein
VAADALNITVVQEIQDALGDFLVRVSCPCGTSRHIEPEALARIAGRSVTCARLATLFVDSDGIF